MCVFAIGGYGQTKFVPAVAALYPTEVKVADTVSARELKAYDKTGVVTEQMRKEFLREGLALNWKTIREKELEFIDEQDFFSVLMLSITRELTYREIENRNDLLIFPLKQTALNTLPACKKVADQHRVSWVVNFVKAEASKDGDNRALSISIQLYNVVTNRMYIDKKFTFTSLELPEDAVCSDVWNCLAGKMTDAIVTDLADKIERNIRHAR
jgi:hypothetical protein